MCLIYIVRDLTWFVQSTGQKLLKWANDTNWTIEQVVNSLTEMFDEEELEQFIEKAGLAEEVNQC